MYGQILDEGEISSFWVEFFVGGEGNISHGAGGRGGMLPQLGVQLDSSVEYFKIKLFQ